LADIFSPFLDQQVKPLSAAADLKPSVRETVRRTDRDLQRIFTAAERLPDDFLHIDPFPFARDA